MLIINKTITQIKAWCLVVVGTALLISIASIVQAGDTLYGVDKGGDIFTVDETTGEGTLVGNLGISSTEIEYDNAAAQGWTQLPNGDFEASEFDLATGMAIGPLIPNGAAFTALEYVGNILYGAHIPASLSPSTLSTLDPATGISVIIGLTGVGPISGLAYDVLSDTMYGIAGGPGPADLLTLDLGTGVATVVGSTGIQAGSLQFGANGQLFAGGTGMSGDAGLLFTIDPVTAANTPVGPSGFPTVTGLTLVTVPIADAGPDQVVEVNTLVSLDGSGSSDPEDNTPLTFAWSLTSAPGGSTATLDDPSLVNPSFTPDELGDYTFALVVTDTNGAVSDPDTVTITAEEAPPTPTPNPGEIGGGGCTLGQVPPTAGSFGFLIVPMILLGLRFRGSKQNGDR